MPDPINMREMIDAVDAASPEHEDHRARLAFLTNAAIDSLDELADVVVSTATPEQSRKILEALAKHVKVLADRLDARAIRSTRFAL